MMVMLLSMIAMVMMMGRLTHGMIECEDLGVGECAFAVASSGARCLLNKSINKNARLQYTCQTSNMMAELGAIEYIETDACIKACGLTRLFVGFSSDGLLHNTFIKRLCSNPCRENCSNIMDLFTKLAAIEGIYLPNICDSFRVDKYMEVSSIEENLHDKSSKGSNNLARTNLLQLPSLFEPYASPPLSNIGVPTSFQPISQPDNTNAPQIPQTYEAQSPYVSPSPLGIYSTPPPYNYNLNAPYGYNPQPPTYDYSVEPPYNYNAESPYNYNAESPYNYNTEAPYNYDAEPPYGYNALPPAYGYDVEPPYNYNIEPPYRYDSQPESPSPPQYDYNILAPYTEYSPTPTYIQPQSNLSPSSPPPYIDV